MKRSTSSSKSISLSSKFLALLRFIRPRFTFSGLPGGGHSISALPSNQSFGHIFPAHSCFDYQQLNDFLSQLKVERITGILNTNKGWFIINGTDGNINYVPTTHSGHSRIEIIANRNYLLGILAELNIQRVQFT